METYEKQGAVIRKYYYAGGQRIAVRVGGVVYWLHADHLGSATLTTDLNGNRVGELRYTPYGVTRYEWGSTPTNRRYTGQRWEGFGLYDYRARFCDPALGRFVQADTLVPQPGNSQSLNRYAYVLNNPLRYTDSTGHWLETVWDIINIGWDVYEVYRDPGNVWNWVALVADVGAAILPIVPAGAGLVVRAGKTAARVEEAIQLGRAIAWTERFAGAGPEIRRGIEFLERMVINKRIPERFRHGFAAELVRAEEYFKAGKLRAVEALVEGGRVDLILVTDEIVEVKYWREHYARNSIDKLLDQLKDYQATGKNLILEFVQTKTDPITEDFVKELLEEAQKRGIPLTREQIHIIP